MIYVAAGNHQVATELARRLSLRQDRWAFVDEPTRLYGLRGATLLVEDDTRHWHRHAYEIMDVARRQDLDIITISLDRIAGVNRG